MTGEPSPEPRWPASVALLVCLGLNLALPERLVVGPRWLLPILITLALVPLSLRRHRHPNESPSVRVLTLSLIALVSVANVLSLTLLVHDLLNTNVTAGRQLVYSAISIWLTNVLVFGVWFWEIDRGGPHRRAAGGGWADLQFPQMENPTLAPPGWRPRFLDYLYTSFANGSSFAPADAMPLSARAKALFASEAVVSLVTVAVVAARAVNILR